MARATTRIPMSHRVLSPNHNYDTDDHRDQPPVHLSGSIFGFLEEEAAALSTPENDVCCDSTQPETEDDDEIENPEDVEEKTRFWDTQCRNIHTTLFRTTSLESRIRSITKEVIGEDETSGNVCCCSKPVSDGCRNCRMSEICSRLQNSGFNSAICKSKWKSSLDIPSGEHTFIDVIDNSKPKKPEVRVIIELELRGQFEMKKGTDDYNRLVSKLPDVFVGKTDRLLTIIKILTTAAKKCMREKKMHLGPWRKQRYMQAKWLRVVDRTSTVNAVTPVAIVGYSDRPAARATSSMLTMDLLDKLPNMAYCFSQTVEVL